MNCVLLADNTGQASIIEEARPLFNDLPTYLYMILPIQMHTHPIPRSTHKSSCCCAALAIAAEENSHLIYYQSYVSASAFTVPGTAGLGQLAILFPLGRL